MIYLSWSVSLPFFCILAYGVTVLVLLIVLGSKTLPYLVRVADFENTKKWWTFFQKVWGQIPPVAKPPAIGFGASGVVYLYIDSEGRQIQVRSADYAESCRREHAHALHVEKTAYQQYQQEKMYLDHKLRHGFFVSSKDLREYNLIAQDWALARQTRLEKLHDLEEATRIVRSDTHPVPQSGAKTFCDAMFTDKRRLFPQPSAVLTQPSPPFQDPDL